jgi:DNA-binding ferritin-like protein
LSVETKEQILEKLEQSRRLLGQAPDPKTTASLRAYIEELEAKLLMIDKST